MILYFYHPKLSFSILTFFLDSQNNEQCDHNFEEASPLLYPGFQNVRLYAHKSQMRPKTHFRLQETWRARKFCDSLFLSHKTKCFHLNILDSQNNEQCDHNFEEASPLLYPGFHSVRHYARKPQMIRVLQFLSIDIRTDFKTKVLFQFFL